MKEVNEPLTVEHLFPKAPNACPVATILDIEKGDYIALFVKYEGTHHYEGRKILLVSRKILKEDPSLGKGSKIPLDPHFMKGGWVLARFKPTKGWWDVAVDMAYNME